MNTETGELLPHDDATLISIEPALPPQPSTLRKVFIGKDGLRAGWSLLIFVAIMAVLIVAANVIGHKLFPSTPRLANDASVITIKSGLIQESIPIVLVLIVTWIMSKIERRPNSVYGLGGSRKLPHFFAGLAWGVTCLSLLVATLWKTGLHWSSTSACSLAATFSVTE